MITKIIIADDHPIFRNGVKDILNAIPNIMIVGEASNGLEAYQLIISSFPDIAIIDLEMPVLSGLDVCQKVMNEKHHTKFIILTMHKEKQYFQEAMKCGVHGYLLKDYAITELVNCIELVNNNEKYVSKEIENFLIEHHTNNQLSDEYLQLLPSLTPTEKVILKLISKAKSSNEIAEMLFISPNTVDNHRANITKKLKLEGKNSLLKFAIQWKTQW